MAEGSIPALAQVQKEDAVGQLRRRDGLMAILGSHSGVMKLDWVEGIVHLLDDSNQLAKVEAEAKELIQRGIHYLIWSGMGGSVLPVQVLAALGFCNGHNGIKIYPLESTDPQALNVLVRQIAEAKGLSSQAMINDPAWMHTLFGDVMMIGVAMGMTSEEPVTHLRWFKDLLLQASLVPAEHLLVFTLVGSSLDTFARAQQIPSYPVQLDGRIGIEGRMSAPSTRVFLLPVALYLASQNDEMSDQLRKILSQAWHNYNLEQATQYPEQHPFIQLACALSEASIDGICHLFIDLPERWVAMGKWIEQVFEQSSGKGGKGVVVFNTSQAEFLDISPGNLSIRVVGGSSNTIPDYGVLVLPEMVLPYLDARDPLECLAAVATLFLGWQLCAVLYCYLQAIPFAGEPAVEWYKQRVRELRTQEDPLQVVDNWSVTAIHECCRLYAPAHMQETVISPGVFFACILQATFTTVNKRNHLKYLDFTYNGESRSLFALLTSHGKYISEKYMRMPVKVRRAPAEYHVSEQSELDGPRGVISLRVLTREHAQCILGIYTDEFLCAQAIGTWQVMNEHGRACFLLILNEPADEALEQFFRETEQELARGFVGVKSQEANE